MRLIVLSKTHAWGRCRPRYETQAAPTHALCLCFDDDVISDPSSNPRGGADEPFNSRCQMPQPPKGGGGNSFAFRDRAGDALSRRAGGGARRDRTDDLMLAKHALYQLSYGPHSLEAAAVGSPGIPGVVDLPSRPPEGHTMDKVWWAQADSNCRPHAYQACALTN